MNDFKQEYIWVYDSNHREYVDDDGVKHNGPIYRKSWLKYKVQGETTRSWLLPRGIKVPKKQTPFARRDYAFSEEELEDNIFKHDHAYKISEKVRSADVATLKKIAELVGYDA